MQSYLTLIEQVKRYNPYIESVQFLVSGDDAKIRDSVFSNICENAFMEDKNLIIIDDTKKIKENIKKVENMGFVIKDGFDNNTLVYNF